MGTAIVIDDSRAMRSMMGRIVTQLGFDCLQAEDGQAALEALDDHGAVTVALVDWNMPRLNGLEFVRAVRADRRYGLAFNLQIWQDIIRNHHLELSHLFPHLV